MVFACELMDLCRGTQEVEAVLSEGAENGSPDPLARLKMAIQYEEKKVCERAFISPAHISSHPTSSRTNRVRRRGCSQPRQTGSLNGARPCSPRVRSITAHSVQMK